MQISPFFSPAAYAHAQYSQWGVISLNYGIFISCTEAFSTHRHSYFSRYLERQQTISGAVLDGINQGKEETINVDWVVVQEPGKQCSTFFLLMLWQPIILSESLLMNDMSLIVFFLPTNIPSVQWWFGILSCENRVADLVQYIRITVVCQLNLKQIMN